ncbi:hypothetical protein O3G_MSEX001470 [Manduca sexta]|uniref:Uncharacterized protein n=1 Tax=Manduca sexta TaxID=7130 RepID=A0A922CCX2_MANSE|nr:hypothetical protein O3G_MSEX001470 [Manduca sexta]
MTSRDCRLASDVSEFADLFPHNALLALGAAGAPLWRRGAAGVAARACAGEARSHAAALAQALPALLRATAADWAPRGQCYILTVHLSAWLFYKAKAI